MENNLTEEQKQMYDLITKYTMKYRQIYSDLIHGGYLSVLAKEEAYNVVVKEFLNENPNISNKIIAKVFFVIGDLSNLIKNETKPKFNFDPNSDLIKFYKEKEMNVLNIRKKI